MANVVGFTLAVLVLVSAVVSGQHQRLLETRLSIDGRAGTNGGPIRTTGYFDVRKDGNAREGVSCSLSVPRTPGAVLIIYSSCRSTKGACFSGFLKRRRQKRKSSL